MIYGFSKEKRLAAISEECKFLFSPKIPWGKKKKKRNNWQVVRGTKAGSGGEWGYSFVFKWNLQSYCRKPQGLACLGNTLHVSTENSRVPNHLGHFFSPINSQYLENWKLERNQLLLISHCNMNIVTMEKKLNLILDFIFEVTVLWTECKFFPLRKPYILKRGVFFCLFIF